MKRLGLTCMLAVAIIACSGNPQPSTTPDNIPSAADITTPEQAENVFLSVAKIVRDTVAAMEKSPRTSPQDQALYARVKQAEEAYKVQARRVWPLLQTWSAMKSPDSRAAWEKAWADLIVQALQVLSIRGGGGGSAAITDPPYPAPVKAGGAR